MDDQAAGATVSGGGAHAADALASDPVRKAAAQHDLLSEAPREQILAKIDPAIAQKIRNQLASQPDRPHGQFSADVAQRRQMIHEMADRVAARRTAEADQLVSEATAPATGMSPMAGGAPAAMAQPAAPAGPVDPLDRLRELHPAAIARAMQGERAEAWAIVLERLDVNARAALQLYLDASARAAIEDAKTRQAELAASSPALLHTVEAAIARTVVPRAMREHHQLLSTTPLAWTGMPA
jgi:hypothetical protein